MRADIQTLCGDLLAATLNGVYQGVVLAILVGVLLRLFVRTNAATRHTVWFASLLLMALVIPGHYWLDRLTPAQSRPSHETAAVSISLPSSDYVFGDAGGLSDNLFEGSPLGRVEDPDVETPLGASPNAGGLVPSPGLEMEPIPHEFGTGPGRIAGFNDPSQSAREFPTRLTRWLRSLGQRLITPVSWSFESAMGWPLLAPLLALASVVTVFRLVMLLWRLRQLQRYRDGSWSPKPELQALFERLRIEGGVRRQVDLQISVRQRSPVLLGFLNPVILLPPDLAAQPDLTEAEHVLRHELAHARRRDDWANLVQHFIQAVFFFHPAVWWISKRLSLEREIACDDHVLEQGGARRNYALILATVASRIHQRTPMLAPGVSNSNSQLQQRISMILNTRRNSSPSLAKGRVASIVSVTALLAVLALYAGPRFVVAQSSALPVTPVVATDTSTPVDGQPAVISSGEVISATPPSIVAQADAPNFAASGVDPGPKFKPENPDAEPPEPADVLAPETPDVPTVQVSPRPMPTPRVARLGKPGKAPRPPESADAMNDGDDSIEGRLKRLEKMVQSLMDQQNPKHLRGSFYFKEGAAQNLNLDQQSLDRLKESAERQSARAAEQAKRVAEQSKHAIMELQLKVLQARAEQEPQGKEKGEFREAYQRQIEALRQARESLGQEMEKLDHQIQKLEKERQRSEKDQQQRSEMPSVKLQAQASMPEPGAN